MRDWQSDVIDIAIFLVLPFGPAALIWWRGSIKKKPVTRDALIATLGWTVVMLALNISARVQSEGNVRKVCGQLKREIMNRTQDDEEVWSSLPTACAPDES